MRIPWIVRASSCALAVIALSWSHGRCEDEAPARFVTRIAAPAGRIYKYHGTRVFDFPRSDFYQAYNFQTEFDLELKVLRTLPDGGAEFAASVTATKGRGTNSDGKAELDTSKTPLKKFHDTVAARQMLADDAFVLTSREFGCTLSARLMPLSATGQMEAREAFLEERPEKERKHYREILPRGSIPLDLEYLLPIDDRTPASVRAPVEATDPKQPKETTRICLAELDERRAVACVDVSGRDFLDRTTKVLERRVTLSRSDGMPIEAIYDHAASLDRSSTRLTLVRTGVTEPPPVPGGKK